MNTTPKTITSLRQKTLRNYKVKERKARTPEHQRAEAGQVRAGERLHYTLGTAEQILKSLLASVCPPDNKKRLRFPDTDLIFLINFPVTLNQVRFVSPHTTVYIRSKFVC